MYIKLFRHIICSSSWRRQG